MSSIYGSTKVSAGYTWQIRLDYDITQNEEANSSTIVQTLYLYHGSAGGYNLLTNSAYYVIGGNKVYKTYDFRDVSPKWTKLGSRTVTVAHEDDGSKSYTLSASWVSDNETTYTPAKISLSKTIELPKIDRTNAWKNIDGVWRRGVYWENVAGTWVEAEQPSVNDNGTWKEGM